MPFFEGASDFEVKGGNFIDVRGNQHNHSTDSSFRLSGTGNTANISPNLSRQDNRTYNWSYSNGGSNGYSQMNNYGVPPNLPPQQLDPQLYYQMFLAWQQQALSFAPGVHPQYGNENPPNSGPTHGQPINDINGSRGVQQNEIPAETRANLQFGQNLPANIQQSPPIQPASGPYHAPPSPNDLGHPLFSGDQPPAAQTTEHPSHNPSQTQPLPRHTPVEPTSEASDILSEPADETSIPGLRAMLLPSLFAQQMQNPSISDSHSPARPLSTQVTPTAPHPSVAPDAPSSLSPQLPSAPSVLPIPSPPSPGSVHHPISPLQMPPPVIPTFPTPSSPLPSLIQQPISSQPIPLPPAEQQTPRPASRSASISSNSDEDGQQIHSMPAPMNHPSTNPSEPFTSFSPPPAGHEAEFPTPSFPQPLEGTMTPSTPLDQTPSSSPAPPTPQFSAYPTLRPLDPSTYFPPNNERTGNFESMTVPSNKKGKSILQKLFGFKRKKSTEDR